MGAKHGRLGGSKEQTERMVDGKTPDMRGYISDPAHKERNYKGGLGHGAA